MCVYFQIWFTCQSAVEASPNEIVPIQRLKEYDDKLSSNIGLKMMLCHSWYLSGELATIILFSDFVSDKQKPKLIF